MPQRNVATNFTFEQQRAEINLLAQDFWTQKGTVDTASTTYLKHDGSNAFTGQTLAVPSAFTINSNSGNGTVTIAGNLQVDGTTTTVNTATMDVVDKNITIAKGSANDAAADGAGITIDSATDITWNFVDVNDAWVSSIGVEATTFLKGPYGQFTGSGTPTTGQGVEVNAPDANTGQIISYDRGNTAYKDLRIKGSSVGVYTGSTNALAGTFNSTGLTMESGKTITGNVTGDLTGTVLTAAQTNITSVGTLSSLGIGVAPSSGEGSELAVKGSDGGTNVALIPGANTESSQLSFYNATYDSTQGYIKYDNNDNSLSFRVNLVERFRITNAGDIFTGHDIQSGNPGQKIGKTTVRGHHVNAAGSFAELYLSNSYSAGGANTPTASIRGERDSQNWGTALTFYTNNTDTQGGASGDGTEKLRITSEGDVSISGDGTIHGVSKLTILPADRTTAFAPEDGDTWHDVVLKQTGDAQTNAVGIAFEISTSGYHKNAGTGIAAVKNGTAGDYGTDLVFITRGQSTAATEKLRIMDDGMVGVGVSDPAVAGGYAGMEIGGTANTGLRLSVTNAGGWAFTDYEINGTQAYIAGVKGGTDSLSSASSWRICTGASLDSNVKFVVNSDGSVLPGSDNTQDLGSTSYRWANLYTGDLNLCNEGSYNEVDGTSGSWTMQEGDSDLFLINRKSGKKYKFNLTEVS